MHAVAARSKLRSRNGPILDVHHFFFVAGARDFAPCHKGAKREGLLQLQLQLHHDYNYNYHHHYHYKPLPWHYNYSYNCDCHYHYNYTTLHYATLNYTTPAYTTPTATATTPTATQPQLQLQLHLHLQLQLHCTRLGFSYPTLRHTLLDYTALQLQLQLQLRYSYNYSKYNYNCTTPGYNYTTLHIDRHPQLKRHQATATQLKLHQATATQHYTTPRYTRHGNTTTTTTTLQLQLQLQVHLQLQLQLQLQPHYTTHTTLHYATQGYTTRHDTTVHQRQVDTQREGDREIERERERLRASTAFQFTSGFALPSMHHSNSPSPIGFLPFKLPPLPCAVLLGYAYTVCIVVSFKALKDPMGGKPFPVRSHGDQPCAPGFAFR